MSQWNNQYYSYDPSLSDTFQPQDPSRPNGQLNNGFIEPWNLPGPSGPFVAPNPYAYVPEGGLPGDAMANGFATANNGMNMESMPWLPPGEYSSLPPPSSAHPEQAQTVPQSQGSG